jgi:hypothetical protein
MNTIVMHIFAKRIEIILMEENIKKVKIKVNKLKNIKK